MNSTAMTWTGRILTGLFALFMPGGAMSAHIRVGSPLFSHTLFAGYLGVITWGGLWCRDARVRALLPFSRTR
jgi:hypothetical protein